MGFLEDIRKRLEQHVEAVARTSAEKAGAKQRPLIEAQVRQQAKQTVIPYLAAGVVTGVLGLLTGFVAWRVSRKRRSGLNDRRDRLPSGRAAGRKYRKLVPHQD